ncbi:hypothetical protein J6590_074781 [Homalodisca vitripennis]|nr:hypothetical protein J6590_074781 [Homalodisca vitripennis]
MSGSAEKVCYANKWNLASFTATGANNNMCHYRPIIKHADKNTRPLTVTSTPRYRTCYMYITRGKMCRAGTLPGVGSVIPVAPRNSHRSRR